MTSAKSPKCMKLSKLQLIVPVDLPNSNIPVDHNVEETEKL